MDGDLLKGKLQINGYSIPQIVDKLNEEGTTITRTTFYRKLRGDSEFTAKEISAIAKIAEFSKKEVMDIFFKEIVS